MPRHPDDIVRVTYEWDVELLGEPFTTEDGEEDVDIVDHCHSETAAEMVATFCRDRAAGQAGRMVLIRETGSESEGMMTRLWAYVDKDDMTLSEFFNDGLSDTGYRVPKKQRAEFDRCITLAYCVSKV